MDVLNANERSSPDSRPAAGIEWPEFLPDCQHPELIAALTRQTDALERLANLLPQVIAQNQVFLRLLIDRDEDDEPERYLDGSPR